MSADQQSLANARPLRVVQLLPALNAGGVERGTVEFARLWDGRELVARIYAAVVILIF